MEAYDIKMPTPPANADLSTMWAYISEGVNHVLGQPEIPLATDSYAYLYTVVYNYCTSPLPRGGQSGASARAVLPGEDLYKSLENELASHLKAVTQEAQKLSDHSLLAYYVEQWERYSASLKILNRLFGFLNRYWTKRERDEGRKTVYPVDVLGLMVWRDCVLASIQSDGLSLSKALTSQISNHRLSTNHSNETTRNSPDGLALAKQAIDSLVSLSIDGNTLTLLTFDIYKTNFEESFLSLTEEFYAKEAEKALKDSTLADYVKKVENWLQNEEDLATKYLHSSTSKPLLSICADILIRHHLDRFYGAVPSLLDAWRTLPSDSQDVTVQTVADLKSINALFFRLPEAPESLRERFGEYVKNDLRNNVLTSGPPGSATPDLEAYRVKYGNLVNLCFKSDWGFRKELEDVIRALNEESTRAVQEL